MSPPRNGSLLGLCGPWNYEKPRRLHRGRGAGDGAGSVCGWVTRMSDEKLQALATALGHIANALDITPERQSPLSPENKAGRLARQALKDAGFDVPSRTEITDSR